MQNILITGGAGFIGSALAKKLLKLGHRVTILDNLSPQIHNDKSMLRRLEDLGCQTVEGDIRDEIIVKKCVKGQDIIYHLASETGTGQSMYQVSQYNSVNIDGTVNLLECLRTTENQVERLILGSSRSVYGEGKYFCSEHGVQFPGSRRDEDLQIGIFEHLCPVCRVQLNVVPTDEKSTTSPKSIYAATKLYQEDLIKIYASTGLFYPYIFRFQNVYGPGQSLSNPYTGILSIFSNLLRNNSKINVFEDGLSMRDFIYIDDVVNFLTKAISSPLVETSLFNLGSGVGTTVLQVIEELQKALGYASDYFLSGSTRKGDIRHNFADLTALSSRFGDYTFCTFNEGVKEFSNWVRNERIVSSSDYNKSLEELRSRNLLK